MASALLSPLQARLLLESVDRLTFQVQEMRA
jgi:hypothetical protein